MVLSDKDIIEKVFKNRCPKCRRLAATIHELEPRSRGKASLKLQNRTAIDRECHEEYHRLGASDKRIAEWEEYIEKYLRSIGTWELYVENQ